VRQPGAIKGGLSCGVSSWSRTEQWKWGEDLLQVHHLTGYELGDATATTSAAPSRFRSGEAAKIGAQTQLDLVRVDRVDVKVDGRLRGAGLAEPLARQMLLARALCPLSVAVQAWVNTSVAVAAKAL
jgi:hypothetical protein